ncbi:response regulator transcription factor [Legionella feeleii]|uniref:Two-component system response regulator PilR n=1 Tax=Legionella feeleii TaxID=453 RepID=A0A378IR51_9GAMM|nr:response regulator [Legionella feeleii]STX37563.1 two-component system response regulator PilR [Legionella feeleii]
MASTVYIVEDDLEVANALEWLLKSVKLAVKTFLNPYEFLAHSDKLEEGCVLLDVRMPAMSGMEVLKLLCQRSHRPPVIMITGHGDIPMAVQAMKIGAQEFITKPFNEQFLLEKIQTILARKNEVNRNYQQMTEVAKQFASLTERERQVMHLVVDGYLNKQIAVELDIAISTVELHRRKIMLKMQARNLAQLIKKSLLLEI